VRFSIEVYNRDPVIIGEPATMIGEGETYFFNLDSDEDGFGNITWSIISGPHWLVIDRETGVLSGIPEHRDIGRSRVRIMIEDGNSGHDDMSIWLQVMDTHAPPRITTEVLEFKGYENEEFGLQMEVSGEGPFSWIIDGDLSLTIDNRTGYISGEFEDIGLYLFDVVVRDLYGDTDRVTISITVIQRPEKPPPPIETWGKIIAIICVNLIVFIFMFVVALWLLMRRSEGKDGKNKK
jgi:hypothetical protein